jgi:metallo-beta-lactamase family protein
MAVAVSRITARHLELFDAEASRLAREAEHPAHLPTLRYTESVADSMALNRLAGGAIIVAASGMCDGGRIRHHLRHHLPNAHTTVIMIGFQAGGTLGRRLVDGARSVKIFGENIPVHARIATLGGFSAHADRTTLLSWLGGLEKAPRNLYLVHGEADVAGAFAAQIQARFGWRAHIPAHGEAVVL